MNVNMGKELRILLFFLSFLLCVLCDSVVSPSSLIAADPPPPPPKGKRPAVKGDLEMVERLLAARKEYQATLEALRAHYIGSGDVERARWSEEELIQYHRINKYPFRLELVVPPPTLQGNYNIPEANELYRQAIKYKDHGYGQDFNDNQHRAELLFQQLLTNYPQSDKISDTAYQLGDIYENKPFRQFDHAAVYFERCFQWNPKTHFDARLRAARLYERYQSERSHALDIYRDITTHETDPKRVEEAQRKVTELSKKK
ncbi:MAG: tetratricopeptide repeat protein [Gemmataceae bacterium]